MAFDLKRHWGESDETYNKRLELELKQDFDERMNKGIADPVPEGTDTKSEPKQTPTDLLLDRLQREKLDLIEGFGEDPDDETDEEYEAREQLLERQLKAKQEQIETVLQKQNADWERKLKRGDWFFGVLGWCKSLLELFMWDQVSPGEAVKWTAYRQNKRWDKEDNER